MKTTNQISNSYVSYGETHICDLPLKYSDRICLVLTLKEITQGKWIKGQEVVLGRAVIGGSSDDLNAAIHWNEMIENTRSSVIKWQYLR